MIAAEIVEMFEALSSPDWSRWMIAFSWKADQRRHVTREQGVERVRRFRARRTEAQRLAAREYQRNYMRQYRKDRARAS